MDQSSAGNANTRWSNSSRFGTERRRVFPRLAVKMIARICNTYGPHMCIDDSRVVSNFVAQALRKDPLTVYGDGKQTRSFQYVSDLVEGLMRLMEGDHIGPFNLGNPGKFIMLELAKVVQDTIDHDGEFNNTIMMMVC
ncbi:hypothetical protein ZWY2020_046321 [Hordeum vulgare]|nr:hypothetical protein ZWY2020_046321 [Hordeum vulgare]